MVLSVFDESAIHIILVKQQFSRENLFKPFIPTTIWFKQHIPCEMNLLFYTRMTKNRREIEKKTINALQISVVELIRLLDSTALVQSSAKHRLCAQVILNWPKALARITRSYSFRRRCLGDERLIGSVESPCWFCSASRAGDEIIEGGANGTEHL